MSSKQTSNVPIFGASDTLVLREKPNMPRHPPRPHWAWAPSLQGRHGASWQWPSAQTVTSLHCWHCTAECRLDLVTRGHANTCIGSSSRATRSTGCLASFITTTFDQHNHEYIACYSMVVPTWSSIDCPGSYSEKREWKIWCEMGRRVKCGLTVLVQLTGRTCYWIFVYLWWCCWVWGVELSKQQEFVLIEIICK